MTLITKPDFTYVWASGGAVVAPNDTKKQQGWVAEAPPFQYDNWLQNRQDQMLAHINQRGIPAWDGLTNYEAGGLSYVQGSDGKVYKSVAASGPSGVVSNPTTDGTDTYWTIAFADVGAFLTQAAGDTRYTQRSNNLGDLTNVAAARLNLGVVKQTSTTDTTAGALMAVGAFGLGATGSGWHTYDLNTLDGSGFYNVNGATSTNLPDPGAFGFLTFIDSTVNDGYQIFTYAGIPNTARTWRRTKVAGAWGAWGEIALINSPTFTGTPTAPTASPGTSTTQLATTAFVQASTPLNLKTSGISGSFSNLKASATGTNATVAVTADAICLKNASNEQVVVNSVAVAPSLAASGVGGLDTGVSAINTWYSVWVIWNGSIASGLLSLSATAPTMPIGYTHKARVGWIRTDGTANKFPLGFIQYGCRVQWVVAPGTNVPATRIMASGIAGNINTPTFVAVAVGTFAPPTAGIINFTYSGQSGLGGVVAPSANYGAGYSITNPPFYFTGNAGGVATAISMVLESSNIYWASTGAALAANGYEDNL